MHSGATTLQFRTKYYASKYLSMSVQTKRPDRTACAELRFVAVAWLQVQLRRLAGNEMTGRFTWLVCSVPV